jgi:hypothetical protein
MYLFISSRLTSVSHEGYVDNKYMHAKTKNQQTKKQQQLQSVERKLTLNQKKSKQTNPPPSAVGFTHIVTKTSIH